MHVVEQRLNSFTYRFRSLSWREKALIRSALPKTQENVISAYALEGISGSP